MLAPASSLAAEVPVRPSDDLQSVVDSSPPGSEFVLAAGVHYEEWLRLRSGDVLRGAPGAELVGSFDLRGVNTVEIREIRLESNAGDCIFVQDSSNIRIRASEIGPCEGNGIVVLRSEIVLVTDNYIHPEHPVTNCCDTGDGIYAREAEDIRIAGNVIAYGETNIELQRTVDAEIVGNYLLNPMGPFPRGQQVQAYDGCRQIVVEGNFMEALRDDDLAYPEHQEDAVNAGQSVDISVNGNFIYGGASPSGCGVIADDDANRMSIVDNTLWSTGQCGIGIASGRDHRVVGNRILNSYVEDPFAGNTAIYVWRQYSGECGPVQVTGNTAYARKPWGEPSSFWKGGSQCDPVTVAQNVFGEDARRTLSEELLESIRPEIPPQPQACMAPSPFNSWSARPACLEAPGNDEPAAPAHSPAPVRSRTRAGKTP